MRAVGCPLFFGVVLKADGLLAAKSSGKKSTNEAISAKLLL